MGSEGSKEASPEASGLTSEILRLKSARRAGWLTEEEFELELKKVIQLHNGSSADEPQPAYSFEEIVKSSEDREMMEQWETRYGGGGVDAATGGGVGGESHGQGEQTGEESAAAVATTAVAHPPPHQQPSPAPAGFTSSSVEAGVAGTGGSMVELSLTGGKSLPSPSSPSAIPPVSSEALSTPKRGSPPTVVEPSTPLELAADRAQDMQLQEEVSVVQEEAICPSSPPQGGVLPPLHDPYVDGGAEACGNVAEEVAGGVVQDVVEGAMEGAVPGGGKAPSEKIKGEIEEKVVVAKVEGKSEGGEGEGAVEEVEEEGEDEGEGEGEGEGEDVGDSKGGDKKKKKKKKGKK